MDVLNYEYRDDNANNLLQVGDIKETINVPWTIATTVKKSRHIDISYFFLVCRVGLFSFQLQFPREVMASSLLPP